MGKFANKDTEAKLKAFLINALKNKDLDIFNNGNPSPSKLAKIFTQNTGIHITRQTVTKYLKMDLSPYEHVIDYSQNANIKEIVDKISIADSIIKDITVRATDRTKALNAWRQLKQQYLDYEQHLKDLEVRKAEAAKPIYLIHFTPGNAERICPKCGHKFYDLKEKKKELFFKSGNGQATLEGDKDKKKNESIN
jgi:hypothetical protein